MRMNWLETALMDSPSKRWLQRHYEAPVFERLGAKAAGGRVLDIGCGNGVGIEIALTRFGAGHVDGLDIDPGQLVRAERRMKRLPPGKVRLLLGDVENIPAEDDYYDAVFDYAVLHHVIDWRKAIGELRRVIRPGGSLFFEEIPGRSLSSWPARVLLKHPTKDRFEPDEFGAELRAAGFSVGSLQVRAGGHVFFGKADVS